MDSLSKLLSRDSRLSSGSLYLRLRSKREGGYAIHPVVQNWCIHLAKTDKGVDLIQLDELALVSVGDTVPGSHVRIIPSFRNGLLHTELCTALGLVRL